MTNVFVFGDSGRVNEYVGGYSDWLRIQKSEQQARTAEKDVRVKKEKPKIKPENKLSYKEKRELEQLPDIIEGLENRQAELNERINQPDFYKQAQEKVSATLSELNEVNQSLEQAYQRWETLDGMSS
ncbi:hypothetical protein [methane-oxidizing endosymbiont of Gigantopelta aegis]|uniref:hypothetical protein n=1 Tax=methane-oxidizing endosymbiont of Gigantopelta aegis TaxID=2794938 RepID=UPI0018DEA3BB|nr:hypothetical protein [methane-oxidizing endosymbiont of Gigantopelta aegis]